MGLHEAMWAETSEGPRQIYALRVGDRLWGRQADTKEQGWTTLRQIRASQHSRFLHFRMQSGEAIEVSLNHPMRVVSEQAVELLRRARYVSFSDALIDRRAFGPLRSISMVESTATRLSLVCEPLGEIFSGEEAPEILVPAL